MNVTWKLQLEEVPPASLPDLHDVGTFPRIAALKKRLCRLSESPFPHLSNGASEAIMPSYEGLVRELHTWPGGGAKY